jgi:hypothetical protein
MLLSPDQYGEASVRELLEAAARGRIGLDHRWLRALLERGEACAPELLAFLREAREDDAFDLEQDVLALARAPASPAMLPVLIELARRAPEAGGGELLSKLAREDPDPAVRRQAVLRLGALQMRGELYRLPPLFRDEQVRREALPAYAALAPLEPSRPGARQCLRKIERIAGGLSAQEGAEVEQILDMRLARAGRFPAFQEIVAEEEEPPVRHGKLGHNEPCPCGSGKKYKKCCGA